MTKNKANWIPIKLDDRDDLPISESSVKKKEIVKEINDLMSKYDELERPYFAHGILLEKHKLNDDSFFMFYKKVLRRNRSYLKLLVDEIEMNFK